MSRRPMFDQEVYTGFWRVREDLLARLPYLDGDYVEAILQDLDVLRSRVVHEAWQRELSSKK